MPVDGRHQLRRVGIAVAARILGEKPAPLRGRHHRMQLLTQIIRLLLTILAISWRGGPDTVLILLVVLGGLAVAGGAWVEAPRVSQGLPGFLDLLEAIFRR